MLEVEVKFPVTDMADLRQRIVATGAVEAAGHDEVDHYFNAPDRDFARTDEALRVRQIGPEAWITYKGPKLDSQTKTRQEIDLPLAGGPGAADQAIALLKRLGYRPVATVRKRRIRYQLDYNGLPIVLSLDLVEGLGPYVEIEAVVDESRSAAAKQAVLELAKCLQLHSSERRSYLELWLERHG